MGFVLDITDSQSQPRLCAFQGLHLTFLGEPAEFGKKRTLSPRMIDLL